MNRKTLSNKGVYAILNAARRCFTAMGIFSGSSKTAKVPEEPVQEFEDIPELPQPRTDTVIAKDVTVTGKITGEGVVQIEGVLEGEAEVQGLVTVAASGRVKGPIKANVVHVAGCVEGNIDVKEHLRLERMGSIEGDVSTVSFIVDDGGRLNGRISMVKPGDSKHNGKKGQASPPPVEDDLQFGHNYNNGNGNSKKSKP